MNTDNIKIIGVIPARYRSSRFPGNPLEVICGLPMICHVYNQAQKVPEFDKIYIATDDERIRQTCVQYHMPVIMTSDAHPTGSDRVAEVATKVDGDLFVNVQGDEPVIHPEMIRDVISIFTEDDTVYFGSLKKEITDPDEIRATSTVKVVTDDKGDAMYFSRSVIPSNIKDGNIARVYRHVGIYAYKRDFLLRFSQMKQTELELGEGIEPLRAMQQGYKIRIKETTHESVGVDLPEHIARVERIIKGEEKLL